VNVTSGMRRMTVETVTGAGPSCCVCGYLIGIGEEIAWVETDGYAEGTSGVCITCAQLVGSANFVKQEG